ncbi:hypothetical protein [Paracidobacterium acidisoli]|uniref:Flagellar FliJ protein n=1 Tax=Paracidobacterium acidisoli TaxID=2303751 RepID=A0A372IRB4_9BACT|nr:hypothetical protein [Paracidobacterium acidisoli]MBT9330293.1 hypothetical protein [Paracidobacterium acidisoli]
MRGNLTRVLRLRTLFEDVSRVEVEQRTQQLARIEESVAREQSILTESLRIRMASTEKSPEAASEERLLARADGDLAQWKKAKLDVLRERKTQEADRAREVWRVRRREQRQVAVVIEAGAAEAKVQEERRMQRSLDDWFQLRRAQSQARQKRGSKSGPA